MKNKRNQYRTFMEWNKYHPQDLIVKGDGFVIHHKDKNPSNDAKINLQKMTLPEHIRLHLKGVKRTDEVKRKISKSNTGKKHSKISKKKMSEAKKNMSEETKRKISKALKGRKSLLIGYKHSEETRKKMSKAAYNMSNEHKRKISQAKIGKKCSKETRNKISKSLKGRIPWNKVIKG